MLTSKELQHWYCSRLHNVHDDHKKELEVFIRIPDYEDVVPMTRRQKLQVILEPRPSYRKSHSMYKTSQSINWYAKVPIDKSTDFRLSIGNRTFDEFLHLLTIDRRLMTRTRFGIINKKKVILTIKSIN